MPKKTNYGRESAALLASSLVLLLGFVGIMFILAVSMDDPLWPGLLAAAAFVAVFCGLIMGLRSDRSGGLGMWLKAKTPESSPDYEPRRVRTSTDDVAVGNRPPTADEVRDLKEAGKTNPSTWVPSSVPKESR